MTATSAQAGAFTRPLCDDVGLGPMSVAHCSMLYRYPDMCPQGGQRMFDFDAIIYCHLFATFDQLLSLFHSMTDPE